MIKIGKQFVVLGEHEVVPSGLFGITILPGIGWGAGWHPSTQAVMRAMENYGFNGESVADVGTGLGILAIAAKKLGAGKVYGIEMKSERAERARQHMIVNNIDVEIIEDKGLQFDVDIVIANLGSTEPTLEAIKHATKGFIVTVDDIDDEFVHEEVEAAGFVVKDVERVSNIGPKAEPVPLNFISHVLVGRIV